MLYLVGGIGGNIDRKRAWAKNNAGELHKLCHGAYVDRDEDPVEATRQYAMRLARHIFENAYVSHESASVLGPNSEGVIYMSGPTNRRVELMGGIVVHCLRAPERPDLRQVTITDADGGFTMLRSSPPQALLEVATRSYQAAPAEMDDILKTLASERGDAQDRQRLLSALAGRHGWENRVPRAMHFFDLWQKNQQFRSGPEMASDNALSLTVSWYATPVGNLRHDGAGFIWEPSENWMLPFPPESGHMPAFLENMMPEGWLRDLLGNNDRERVAHSRRLLSNIVLLPKGTTVLNTNCDMLLAPLEHHLEEGEAKVDLDDAFCTDGYSEVMQEVAQFWQQDTMPRMSGVQAKVPVTLLPNGAVVPAVRSSFTHILKMPGINERRSICAVEWLGLELSRAAGLETAVAGMVRMPQEGSGPALLVERFDIPAIGRDDRMILAEDFCSLLREMPDNKYQHSAESVAGRIRDIASDPAGDMEKFLARLVLTVIIGDGDAHLKNFMMLKSASRHTFTSGAPRFDRVALAPVFDTMTTRIYPQLGHEHLAMSVNGRRAGVGRDDLIKCAATIGVGKSAGARVVDVTAERIAQRVTELAENLPMVITEDDQVRRDVLKALRLTLDNCRKFGADAPQIDFEALFDAAPPAPASALTP